MSAAEPVALRPLGAGWAVWDTFVVRAAGLPFEWLAEQRTPADVAAEPAFREAVSWQNPGLAATLRRGYAGKRPTDRRAVDRVVWAYAQRYCAKNDTIGRFGPAAWGTWSADGTSVGPAGRRPRSRDVCFELWAVQAVAEALEERHGLTPWTVVHLAPSVQRTADGVRLADGSVVRLDPAELRLLSLVDGRRTGADLASEDGEDPHRRLARLRAMGIVTSGFAVPRGLAPERTLRGGLLRVPAPERRGAALADLDALVAARDATAAAGDPDTFGAAMDKLGTVFAELTGRAAGQRPGEFYAGRALVFEDTTADLDTVLGTDVLTRLTPPLALLLDSALWFCNAVADAYERWIVERFGERARQPGGVPLGAVLDALTPLIELDAAGAAGPAGAASAAARAGAAGPAGTAGAAAQLSGPADPVAAELIRRWATLLGPAPSGAPVHRTSAELRPRAAELFATGAPRWARARWQSPDVMFAAASAGDLAAGRYVPVLGELHAGLNATDHMPFDRAHPDRAALHARIRADTRGKFVPLYPLRGSPLNSRTMPPDWYLSDEDVYLGTGSEPPYQPRTARTLPVSTLRLHLDGDVAVVRTVDGRPVAPLVEVIGDHLSHAAAQRFRLAAPARHRPRIVIDDLVVSRESWSAPLAGLPAGAAFPAGLRAAFPAMATHRYLFATVTGERKPFLVDADNSQSLAVLAHRVLRRRATHPDGRLVLTEMLPGPDGLWLRDDRGRRYTVEFRLVCVRAGAETLCVRAGAETR